MTDHGARQAENSSAERCVIYVLDVAERPGIVHAIAAVFAHRGLSMRALIADAHRRPPRIFVVFSGTARQARLVSQVLARLHDVHGVRVLPADSQELRAVALCSGIAPMPALSRISAQQVERAWLLSGSYADVEAALNVLDDAGMGGSVSRSLVAL